MSKKKMLFFHHCGTVGGAGISGLNFLNSVPKDLYDVTVYSVSSPDNMVRIFRENGYRVIEGGSCPASFTHCVGSKKLAVSPKAIMNYLAVKRQEKTVDKVICDEKPDVVVANSMTLFWIGKIAKKYGAETICFFRETYIRGLFGIRTSYIKRNLSKYFDKIAFISNYELVRSKSIKSQKTTIYNMIREEGYDRYGKEEARKKISLEDDKFYVLFVGGVNQLKGTLELFKALDKIEDKDIKVLFVGGTYEQLQKNATPTDLKRKIKGMFSKNYSKKCLEFIDNHGLRDRIVFFPSQSDIAPFFRASDILAFPMTAPHQARPLFEAGYARIPVVVTDFDNIKELVDENSGYLFENRNYKELAEIINYVKNNYSESQKKVELNYKNTIARHSPEVYKRQIERLLEGALENENQNR